MSNYIDKINQLSADIHFKLEGSGLSNIFANYGVNTQPYTFSYFNNSNTYSSVTGIVGTAIRSEMDDLDNYISNCWVSTDDASAFLTSPFEKTFNFWLKIDNLDQYGGSLPIIEKLGSSTSARIFIQKRSTDDTIVTRITDDNGTTQVFASGISPTYNTWQMFTIVIPANGSGNYVKYYLNGSFVSQVAMNNTYGTVTFDGPTGLFGTVTTAFGAAGQFDEFSIFNYNLSNTEIAEVYDAAFSTYNTTTPFTVTAQMPNATVYVTPNYYALVKAKNPVFYIKNGEVTAANIVNHGSDSWGTPLVGSAVLKQSSKTPFGLVNEGFSWGCTTATSGALSTTTSKVSYNNSNAWSSLKNLIATNNFSVEFWINPTQFLNLVNSPAAFFNLQGTGNNYVQLVRTAVSSESSAQDALAKYQIGLRDGTVTYTLQSSSIASPEKNKWHQFVLTVGINPSNSANMDVKLYVDTNIVYSGTMAKLAWANLSASIYSDVAFSMVRTGYSQWDELAIYPTALTASQIIDNYSFISNLSPDKTITPDPMVASGQMTDAIIAVTVNKNIGATALTASSLMVDPTIGGQKNVNVLQTTLTASGLMVEPFFYGNPDRSLNPLPLTAQADFLSATKKNTAYSDFIKNLGPYRYHSLDNIENWILGYPADNTNEGSDTTYTLNMFDVGLGTHSLAQDVINNYSVHSEMNYQTNNYQRSLVIKESVYNDMWGTDLPSNGTGWTMGFWFREHESFTYQNGLILLANINGSSTGDHVVLYYDGGRIFVEINDGGTKATYETSPVTLFNNLKHNIVMTLGKVASNAHEMNIYFDGVKVLTQDIGALHPQIIPSSTVSSPNSTNYNIVSLGGMITLYGNTFFNTVPQNLNAYFDEFFWFKSSLSQTQVTNQFNAMPGSTPVNVSAAVMTASALVVDPTTSLGVGISQTALTSTALMVSPVIYTDFDRNINASPFTASALMPTGVASNNIVIYVEDVMLASGLFPLPSVTVTIPGGPMIANANAVMPDLINGLHPTTLNSYIKYLRYKSLTNSINHYVEVN